jgi:SAM-dependent methyltransferase
VTCPPSPMPRDRTRPSRTGLDPADAFGRALIDALEGISKPLTVERDDGWRDEYVAALYLNDAEAWAPAARQALEAVRGRVLDVGAGGGRHASLLERRGCEVTAVDISAGAVEACRRRGLLAIRGAVGEPGLLADEQFDAVLLLGHNLGLLQSFDKAPSILRWLADRCRPGAVLIGDSLDTTVAATASWRSYHELNRERGRRPGEARMRICYAGSCGEWFDYWLLSPQDLVEVSANTPWEVERIDFDDDDRFAGDYVAILHRR